MSEEELPELAEVEPAFVRRAVRSGALEMVAQAPAAGLPPTHIGIHCGPVELKGLAHPLEVFRALA